MEDVTTTFGTIPATKETFVDPIAVLDPVGDAKDVDPSLTLCYDAIPHDYLGCLWTAS